MYSNLSTVTPDLSFTLDIAPHNILEEYGTMNQEVLCLDDGSEIVLSYTTEPKFFVTLEWGYLSEDDAETIFNAYNSTCQGMAKSFNWDHPTDEHTYTVRFASDVTRTIKPSGNRGIKSVRLQVLGN